MTKRRVILSLFAILSLVGNSRLVSDAYADGGGAEARLPGSVASGESLGGADRKQHHSHAGADRRRASAPYLGEASQEQTTEAVAHFARARALLITALHEFDKGRKIASPNNLLDSGAWRNTLIDRAEDLDRVLDPQPRATKGGLRFEADPRLLPEATK